VEKDPVLRELHEAKDKLAAKYGFSVDRLGKALIRKQRGMKNHEKPSRASSPSHSPKGE
jgi:hypothetical protein